MGCSCNYRHAVIGAKLYGTILYLSRGPCSQFDIPSAMKLLLLANGILRACLHLNMWLVRQCAPDVGCLNHTQLRQVRYVHLINDSRPLSGHIYPPAANVKSR